MTKILWSGIGVTQGSGKLGNEIYSRNQAGYYKKAYASPIVNPNAIGLAVRDIYALLADAWGELDYQRQLRWNTAAKEIVAGKKLHQSKCMSGWNYFYQVNFNLVVIDQAVIFDPPPKKSTQQISLFGYTGTPTTTSINLSWVYANNSSTLGPYSYLMLCMSACWNRGRFSNKVPINFIKYFSPSTNPNGTNIVSAYTAIWGSPVANSRIFMKSFIIDSRTGLRSAYSYSGLDIL